jgi:hypothetical protein
MGDEQMPQESQKRLARNIQFLRNYSQNTGIIENQVLILRNALNRALQDFNGINRQRIENIVSETIANRQDVIKEFKQYK